VFDLFDDDLDQMELIEGALALNCAVKPSVDKIDVMRQLGELFIEAEMKLAHEPNEKLRFESLLRLFYNEWGFKGDQES
jgi:regulator of sirC expression with transglutaminase-like and TPR domain